MRCCSSTAAVKITTVPTSRFDEHLPASLQDPTLLANPPPACLQASQHDKPSSPSRGYTRSLRLAHVGAITTALSGSIPIAWARG
jgi:hypothetical protein